MRGEVQQPEPAAPSHEGMTTAVCVTASSANATMERLTTRGRWLGLSGHDYGRYAAILHLTVMIGIAFAQAHRTYGPAGRRTHVWGARIRVQTVLWHRSSRICPQVKDSQAWIARPFTKRLLTERRQRSGPGSRPSAAASRPGRAAARLRGWNARWACFPVADLRGDFLWAVLCAFMCVALPGRRLTVGPRQSGQALTGPRPRRLERGRAPS